jgi:hypothetical protein
LSFNPGSAFSFTSGMAEPLGRVRNTVPKVFQLHAAAAPGSPSTTWPRSWTTSSWPVIRPT